MRKIISIAVVGLAIGALAAGTWSADRSQRRAKEIAANEGSVRIKASGVLHTTVDVYDANDIAKAAFDFDLVEDHREALRQLGFTTVHVKTATGETLDRPL
jgi:hypothetical protein